MSELTREFQIDNYQTRYNLRGWVHPEVAPSGSEMQRVWFTYDLGDGPKRYGTFLIPKGLNHEAEVIRLQVDGEIRRQLTLLLRKKLVFYEKQSRLICPQ